MHNAHITGIRELKFLLILGVVLIHCNLSNGYSPEIDCNNIGVIATTFISAKVCRVCVPAFFFISAVLFFNGVNRFTPEIYVAKLRRRVKSLLVPYLLWCTFCALLLFIKHRFLHMSGLDIFMDDGSVNWLNLIKGYWAIDAADGFPFAFAFWFIRNLMVFVILSPLAYIIGKRVWLTALLFACQICFDLPSYGFEWFVAGCFFSGKMTSIMKPSALKLTVASVIFWCCALAAEAGYPFSFVLYTCQIGAAIYLTYSLAGHLKPYTHKSAWLNTLMDATFMIYAVHQCFCSVTRSFWIEVYGSANFIMPVCAYVSSFLTLTCSGVVAYVILRRLSPHFLSIITGGRL